MKYRAEIDGLRAIAVIPVILFHAGFKSFHGGFVGVDVFFVISGYLITTIILSEKEQGSFSLVNFYERRARRILPPLFLVMLVSILFAWLWLLPSDMKDFSESLVAVSFFSSNILFWTETGYWGTANELKPLLHTWSLAIEEQYYILFPLFLMLMWKFRKRWIFSSFMLIAVTSLAVSQWGAYNRPSANFFLLPTRGWELAIGAGIAFYFLYRKQTIRTFFSHQYVDELLGLIGLLMIGYSVFLFDETVPFPSLYALIPTIGTGLIILFSSPHTLVGRFLSLKLLVGIGLISYSAYLWHQPLLAFARNRSVAEEYLVVIAAFSFPLAYLTWKFIEKPFRNKGVYNRKAIFIFSVTGTIIFTSIGIAGHISGGFSARFEVPKSVTQSIERRKGLCFDREYAHKADSWLCGINGEELLNPDFLVVGDSHMFSFLPAFKFIDIKKTSSGAYVGFSGCPPLLGVQSIRSDYILYNCHDLNNRVFHYVKKQEIKNVVLVARWTYYTDGDYNGKGINYLGETQADEKSKNRSRQIFNNGLRETIRQYGEIGVAIHIILQVPMQEYSPEDVYIKSYLGNGFNDVIFTKSALSLEKHKQFQLFSNNSIRQVVSDFPAYNVQLYNPADVLCDGLKCTFGTKDTSYYFDDDHLSITGAEFLGRNMLFKFEK